MDKNKSQILDEIKKLEAAKNFDGMLAAAQKAWGENPEDKDFRTRVHDAQAEYVNDKLNSKLLVDLEKKGDWQGLLAVYEKLLSVFPESDRLQHLLKDVRQKILDTQKKERTGYFKNAKRSIEDMILKGQLDDAEQACYEMLALDNTNKHFIHLLAHIQHVQDKEMDKLLTLYFQETVPELKSEYKANKDQFIRV